MVFRFGSLLLRLSSVSIFLMTHRTILIRKMVMILMGLLSRLTPRTPQTSLSQRKEDSGGEMLSEQNSLVSVPCWPNGIDISNHQPQFDWAAWNGHIQFASVKATEGLTFQDAWFGYNWGWMEKIGVFRFAYHYAHPNLDPVKQAKFLVDYVKLHGLKRHDNFVLDLEETGGK